MQEMVKSVYSFPLSKCNAADTLMHRTSLPYEKCLHDVSLTKKDQIYSLLALVYYLALLHFIWWYFFLFVSMLQAGNISYSLKCLSLPNTIEGQVCFPSFHKYLWKLIMKSQQNQEYSRTWNIHQNTDI